MKNPQRTSLSHWTVLGASLMMLSSSLACGQGESDAGEPAAPGTGSPGGDGTGDAPSADATDSGVDPGGEDDATDAGAAGEDETGEPPTFEGMYVEEATAALAAAIGYYHGTLSTHGGYVWTYAVDLSRHWGEGETTDDQIWVQPPGTPAIGLSVLGAYDVTGEPMYLSIAREAGDALRYGQVRSGGWDQAVDFDPNGERIAEYRNGMGGGGRDVSVLDDGITQTTLQFLIELDLRTGLSDPDLADAIDYGLDALYAAQHTSGAFSQIWDEEGIIDTQPMAATIPDPYPTTSPPGNDYWDLPTLNDSNAGYVSAMLLTAHRAYDDPRARQALDRLGEFLLLAQLPAPQRAWAQQYTTSMQPSWARKFEPPAVSGWESQDVLEVLLRLYALTDDSRYADAAGEGLAYLQTKHLPDGQLARFYELTTDLPLYMTSDYELTYDDSDVPGHYGWKFPSRLDEIEAARARLVAGEPEPVPDFAALEAEAKAIIDALDDQGRWIDVDIKVASGIPQGDYILSSTFVANVDVLVEYLRLTGG